eukprot:TRINITY_DN11783_c0_g1_i1.p1 TRINITY_DN11783_c0_g1~~TRINITY_DN11783_c0_g1_i1.p1  ORF type:complete len:142 (+),score=41.14 TRINITY_DN11783_c0_g1_i1:119-544(+)
MCIRDRFCKLDRGGTGSITREDFLRIPELAANPLAEHILNSLDADRDRTVDFEEFVKVLSAFNCNDSAERLQYIFSVYDQDNDGYLTTQEVLSVLRTVLTPDQSEEDLRNIVSKTISSVDMDGDGKVSFMEFQTLLGQPYK